MWPTSASPSLSSASPWSAASRKKKTSRWRPAKRSCRRLHFTFNGVKAVEGPNYLALAGRFRSAVNGKFQRKMNPEKRNYHSSHADDRSRDRCRLLRDVYVSLGEPIDRDKPEGEWAVRVYYKPFVDWIWGGCALMALGGLLAMLDRRYRVKARASARRSPPRQEANKHEPLFLDPRRLRRPRRFARRRPRPQPARRAFAAGRQAGAGLHLPVLAAPEKTLGPKDMQGKVWLLNVWASWCVSCRQEHPVLVEFSKKVERAADRPQLQGSAW
jgi:hypothetical protein